MNDIKLYQAEWCEFSALVRRELDRAGVEYELVEVPMDRADRHELVAATGDASIPVLVVDGIVYPGAPKSMAIARELGRGFGQQAA